MWSLALTRTPSQGTTRHTDDLARSLGLSCVRGASLEEIQVPHHGECVPAALRGIDAPDENFKLTPLARPSMPSSMPCLNECAIDPYLHSLGWFGDDPRVIDFLERKRN